MTVARERLDRRESDGGRVPGLPEWTYDFHGRGLCLTRPGHETLDVDFFSGDEGPQTIDPHFFTTRIRSLSPRPAVERRLIAWFGDGGGLLLEGLRELRDAGVIEHPTSAHVFHLHPWLERTYDRLATVDFEDRVIWHGWAQNLGDEQEEAKLRRDAFNTWGMTLLEDRGRARVIDELAPLLPAQVAIAQCLLLFAGPVDSATGRAVRALRRLGIDPTDKALALLDRLDPEQHNPFSAVELAEWLFERGLDDKALGLIQRFARQRKIKGFRGNPFDAAYAILALRFAPSDALPLVRQALRSRTPDSVHRAASLLSVLDEPWCRHELLAAAEGMEDPESLRFLIGCLMHSADEETLAQARGLLPPPPDFTGSAVGYTHEEVAFLNLRENVAFHRGLARATAAVIRPN